MQSHLKSRYLGQLFVIIRLQGSVCEILMSIIFPSVTIFDKADTKGSGTVLMLVNAKSLESPRKPRVTILPASFFTCLVSYYKHVSQVMNISAEKTQTLK